MRIILATLAAVSLTGAALPAFAADEDGNRTNFASEGGLGTTRIVRDCDENDGTCSRFGSGWAGDARVRAGDCQGQRNCEGFASEGGLGTTRVQDGD